MVVVDLPSPLVQEVQVMDTGRQGVYLEAGAEAQLSRVKIVGATGMGIFVVGSELEVFQSVVRDKGHQFIVWALWIGHKVPNGHRLPDTQRLSQAVVDTA